MSEKEPDGVIKFPRKAPLVLPPGVVPLRIKPVPIASGEGLHWTCAVDLLKELIHDIETGRVHQPDMIYVAMQTRNEEDHVAHPSYNWFKDKRDGAVKTLGLLSSHLMGMWARAE